MIIPEPRQDSMVREIRPNAGYATEEQEGPGSKYVEGLRFRDSKSVVKWV